MVREGAHDSALVDALRRLVLVFGAARTWLWLRLAPDLDSLLFGISAVALTGCAALAFVPSRACWAPRIALPVLALQLAATFPLTDNHFYLEVVAVALLAVAGPADGPDDALTLRGLRWVVAIVLMHTGIQKVLHGLYFQGEFLAFMVGRGGRFADAVGWMLPVDELARLASYDPLRTGAGPYRVDTAPLLLLSNAVWSAEIALGALLLVRRTRAVAACIALALVLVIQLGAREFGFAILFGNLLLVFLPPVVARRVLPIEAAVLGWAIGATFDVLPGGGLIGVESL